MIVLCNYSRKKKKKTRQEGSRRVFHYAASDTVGETVSGCVMAHRRAGMCGDRKRQTETEEQCWVGEKKVGRRREGEAHSWLLGRTTMAAPCAAHLDHPWTISELLVWAHYLPCWPGYVAACQQADKSFVKNIKSEWAEPQRVCECVRTWMLSKMFPVLQYG